MKLSEREICGELKLLDLKPGNHIYLKGYRWQDLDFIIGCVDINNKAISILRPNNPYREIEFIDWNKSCNLQLGNDFCIYEDVDITRAREHVEAIDEIWIERNLTPYHSDFRLRELPETPPWSWQTNCDVSKLKNGDKLVIHYFTAEDELKIRSLEMGDFHPNSRYRKVVMYYQYQYVGKPVKIDKVDVTITCDPHDAELERTGMYDFKLGNNIIVSTIGTTDVFKENQFYRICGLQLVPKK